MRVNINVFTHSIKSNGNLYIIKRFYSCFMARLRPGKCYVKLKRPLTRKSRYRSKSYVKGVPNPKITHFHMGYRQGGFPKKVCLKSKEPIQIRHNALESARIAANRVLTAKVGKENFHLIINVFPHNVMREHKLAGVAQADRYFSGMSHAYGKAIGYAARVKDGQKIMSVEINEKGINDAKKAFKNAAAKLPCKCSIELME